MTARAWTAGALAAVLSGVFGAGPVGAITIGGGGSSRTDCLLAFDGNFNDPVSSPRKYTCVDGDPLCDEDGLVNGQCTFDISACANSTYNPLRCTLAGINAVTVDHALDNGDPKFDTEFQAFQTRLDSDLSLPTNTVNDCTGATTFSVILKGPYPGNVCKKNKKQIRVTTLSQVIAGKLYTDKDKLRLVCKPSPLGCDPQQIYTSTFDRIQRQVFNQNCAVSGCHDSQSFALSGNLLLETGASYTNLVNAAPDNSAAQVAGYERVNKTGLTTGDPNNSFLYRKIANDLDAGMGSRMPLGRPALNTTLIEIIRLWIEAGAPATGWVPGTF